MKVEAFLTVFNLVPFGPSLPRGTKYPNSRGLDPKIHTLSGFWTLKPYYLGTWTLRASFLVRLLQRSNGL